MKLVSLASLSLMAMVLLGQAPPPAAPKPAAAAPKPAAAKPPASSVDSVIQSVKAGLSESLIIRTIQRENKPANLTTADLVKLKNAGVSGKHHQCDARSRQRPAAAAATAPSAGRRSTAVRLLRPQPPRSDVLRARRPQLPSAAQLQAQKKRVIVDEFDYSTVKTRCKPYSIPNRTSAKAFAPCWSSARRCQQRSGRRARQDQQHHEGAGFQRQQPREARQRRPRGQISGADAMLSGDIVVFGRDDKKRSVKGGGLFGGVIGGIAASKNEDKAVVVIDYRLIDAETSEIIATGEARGESARKGNALGAIGGALGKGVAGVQVDMTSSNFAADDHRRGHAGLRQQTRRHPEGTDQPT